MSENGIGGLFSGLGRGLTGLLIKPVVGIFDAATAISDTVKNTSSGVIEDKKVHPVRLQRAIYGPVLNSDIITVFV